MVTKPPQHSQGSPAGSPQGSNGSNSSSWLVALSSVSAMGLAPLSPRIEGIERRPSALGRVGEQVPVGFLDLQNARPGHPGNFEGRDPGRDRLADKVCLSA
jgi:hypothetical protein